MPIDLPTILFLEMTTSLIAALLLATARHADESAGLNEARAAMLALVPAFALQLARGHAPEALVIVGSNLLFWLSCALIYASYARFAGARTRQRWAFVYVGVMSAIFAVSWTLHVPYGVRACVTSVNIATLLTAALLALARDDGFRREPSRRVSFALISLVTLPMWLRVLVLLPQLGADLDPRKPSLETALGFFPAVLLVQGFALSFLMMQRERGEALARTQAITDPLTSCLNRRALEERVRSELAYKARVRRPFAVLVVDLDHFKKINDQHGHAAGDTVLIHSASVLRTLVRPSDVVARYGGEEFCLLLRDTNVDAAAVVAERVRGALRDQRVLVEGGALSVTASIGVAAASVDDTESWESLFRRADEALYRAKGAGRDRIELSTLPPSTTTPSATTPSATTPSATTVAPTA
jgi:diguanylate cyclase (GGDEF)-like protein